MSVFASGSRTFVSTDFGLSVTYDGSSTVSISVPSNYRFINLNCSLLVMHEPLPVAVTFTKGKT